MAKKEVNTRRLDGNRVKGGGRGLGTDDEREELRGDKGIQNFEHRQEISKDTHT